MKNQSIINQKLERDKKNIVQLVRLQKVRQRLLMILWRAEQKEEAALRRSLEVLRRALQKRESGDSQSFRLGVTEEAPLDMNLGNDYLEFVEIQNMEFKQQIQEKIESLAKEEELLSQELKILEEKISKFNLQNKWLIKRMINKNKLF